MAMAQGLTQEQVESILEDIDGTTLIDGKTRRLLHLAAKINLNADKVTEADIEDLRGLGCSEEEIFEAVAVTSLFNCMDRMADALGAPVEGFRTMVAEKMQN
jgi:alkylhydroperoxidase family enzyme